VAADKPGYHHGDLRRALLDAALSLVSEKGLSALTLREVARKVGVTHAAPYHHFPTRDALLDALAHDAFCALDVAMARATHDVADLSERLFLVGKAYTDFARAHPEQLQIMFRRQQSTHGADGAANADLFHASGRAFAHLYDAVVAAQAQGLAPAGDPFEVALLPWSVVHGFAKLWVEGPLDTMAPYEGHFERMRDQTLRLMIDSWKPRAHE
jgi:AcrR family transcriptional regulator